MPPSHNSQQSRTRFDVNAERLTNFHNRDYLNLDETGMNEPKTLPRITLHTRLDTLLIHSHFRALTHFPLFHHLITLLKLLLSLERLRIQSSTTPCRFFFTVTPSHLTLRGERLSPFFVSGYLLHYGSC
jgi:hypothetical protein